MLFCSFLSIDMFVLFTRYSLRFLSLKFKCSLDISSIKLLLYKVYGIRFRSEIQDLLVQARRIRAVVL